ncbi:cytochrome P450 [Phaeosphaeria sp. MPI-PUGE-AT-0046c]|nr:cytochrome P450 [Phaeosphaeria sp. MPI-PUGE-AT-0046c]
MAFLPLVLISTAVIILLHRFLLTPFLLNPLSRIPGPKSYAFTRWRLAKDDWGRRTRTIQKLHQQYGPVVRIGPKEVHFNSTTALRTIYGAGSGFERTSFYEMFNAYGKRNLFTFAGVADHAKRKRLLAHVYSKSAILTGHTAVIINDKIKDFLRLLESTPGNNGVEIFSALHYYAIDVITTFLYGTPDFGATTALQGTPHHVSLLNDIMDPSRRHLAWFAVHFRTLTTWLYTQTGQLETMLKPLLPMQKPATYTGIRAHALHAMHKFRDAEPEMRARAHESIIARLWKVKDTSDLDDLDVASECADHLLAGIDTTSDTLMFLIWALSLPKRAHIQRKLIEECRSISPDAIKDGVVSPNVSDRLPYLDAVIKETLRLYAPLPASEPRSSPVDTVIDGYAIPRGTVCCMAPYSLHRNAEVFPNPLEWDPERWLKGERDPALAEMRKWWWSFSSGARMCVGMHLAMAEMALVPSIYRKYSTNIRLDFVEIAPGITSRFEVLTDETFAKMEEHTCWVTFEPHIDY